MQYTVIFHDLKNDYYQIKIVIFVLFLFGNIDRGYTLEKPQAVLTSTHDLCLEQK